MTYYTLPKLFKYDNSNNNIIKHILLVTELNKDNIDNSLLEKLLNTLIDDNNKSKYDEIKNKYSFTDLLNLKISDEIYHPKSYFAFIEINKICKFFLDEKLKTLNMSTNYDYLNGLYQIRNDDEYVFTSENYQVNVPEYILFKIINTISEIDKVIKHYSNYFNMICINYDDLNLTIKNILLAIILQKNKGNMIIKFKRLNNLVCKEIIFLLMSLYDNVLIIKPKIINSVNEYKYVIANKMVHKIDNNIISMLIETVIKINNLNKNTSIIKLLNIDIPQILINKIDECELIMSENILTTHMKILNSIHVNNINIKSVEKKAENDSKLWLKENN